MSEPGVHCGQVGQPRPDAVRRTEPPVPTMMISVASDAHAKARARRVTSRGVSHRQSRPNPLASRVDPLTVTHSHTRQSVTHEALP